MSARNRGQREGGASSLRQLLSLIAALALLLGSILIMYPGILHKKVETGDTWEFVESARAKFEAALNSLYGNENVQIEESKLGFENFPLYGNDYFYGVEDVFKNEELHGYIKGDSGYKPDVGELIKNIYTNPKLANADQSGEISRMFIQKVYDIILIALISIPIYMLLRLLIYNALYDRISESVFLISLPLRGIATVACGVTSTCLSWMLYNTVLFDKLLNKLINWINGLSVSDAAEAVSRLPSALAVNASHIIVIVVLIALILAMIKLTVFRGSVFMSVFLGIFRSLLFVIAFAFINVFIGDWTWRVVLFGAIFVVAAGMIERLFDR